ncbi:MAG: hypothetical protein LUQ18_01115 [Methylococcaceae bacterium]|nr:hypothetical protein [Methylococcaceae bacterium]
MNQSKISDDSLPNASEEIIKAFERLGNEALARIREIIISKKIKIDGDDTDLPNDINNISFQMIYYIYSVLVKAGVSEYEGNSIYYVVLFCEAGLLEVKKRNTELAIKHLCRAFSYSEKFNDYQQILLSQKIKNARKRHTENYALKDDAIAYYEDNIDLLKNKSTEYIAAQILTNKIIPNTTKRTIAHWISEHRNRPPPMTGFEFLLNSIN